MIFVTCLLLLAATAINCQNIRDYRFNPYYDESPKPYAFNYNSILEDGGQSARTETADGSGRVQGSYSFTNDQGHSRVVDYIADHEGFRASIRTNEPGTDNQNPADVVIESAGPHSDRVYRPYQYSPVIRRPVVNAPIEPIAPVGPVEPAVMPENILQPVRRPIYRRPTTYTGRNYQARPPLINPYTRS